MQIQDIWYPIKDLKRSGTPTPRFLDELNKNMSKNLTPVYHYCEDAEFQDQQLTSRKSVNSKNEDLFSSNSNTNQIIEELRNIITDQMEESARQKELEQQKCNDLKLISTNSNTLNVKEMPLNPFDFIWFNNLVPKQDELNTKANLFEAMYEEYALIKSKSILSAENNKSQNNNCNNSNWSFSSSNNPLFSDDYTISSRSCMSKCGAAASCAGKKKKEKKMKIKKSGKNYISKSVSPR